MSPVVALRPAGRDRHLELLGRLGLEPGPRGSFFDPVRDAARGRYQALGFPGPKAEAWRFTPLQPLLGLAFERPSRFEVPPAAVPRPLVEGAHELVFVNGRLAPALCRPARLGEGVFAGGLADAIQRGDEVAKKHLGRHASFQDRAFTALNTALVEDGALVSLAAGASALVPIHLLFLSTSAGAPIATQPRTLVVAGEGSRAIVIESHVGLGGATFANAVTEVVLGPGAQVQHLALVREGGESFHLAALQAIVERGARFFAAELTLSGARVRRELSVTLAGEGAKASLAGLYLGGGEQHVDHHTFVDHAVPGCASEETYRGIVGGHAHAVFDGHILVRPDAQKSSANLANKNLLLSDDAVVDAKPMLEIFADDVKATHGAAVGQLDPDSLFYLRARGIGEVEARRLLTRAFAREVLERIEAPALAGPLEALVLPALARIGGEAR